MFVYDNIEYIADIYATVNCFNPVPAFYDCIKSKNYDAIPPNYYIMTTAMNFSWVVYALKTQNDVLYNVSMKYTLLFTAFALLSIFFRKDFKKIFSLVAIIVAEYFILNMLDQKYLGLSCTIVQLISDSLQWESILNAYKTKNPSFINLKQQIISTVSSLLWTIIGFKASDPFLFYPNGYNTILHLIQIMIVVTFGNRQLVSVKNNQKSE